MSDNKEFVWTDELVKEWSDHVRLIFNNRNNNYCGKYDGFDTDFEKWKAVKSKEKDIPKDWIVLSFLCEGCVHNNGIIKRFEGSEDCFQGGGTEAYHLKNHKIHSVKRLSDGEVFSVGDFTNKGIITGIEKTDQYCYHFVFYADRTQGKYPFFPHEVEKVNQKVPLLHTEKNEPLYNGEDFYYMPKETLNWINRYGDGYPQPPTSFHYFKTKEDAVEFQLLNKPTEVSYKELMAWLTKRYDYKEVEYDVPVIKEFFQTKINL